MVITDTTTGKSAAIQPTGAITIPLVGTNGTDCKPYETRASNDPCVGEISWDLRGGTDLALHQEAVEQMLQRYQSSQSPSATCLSSWRSWLCGQSFRRCQDIKKQLTEDPEDDPANTEPVPGDMECTGYVAPCLSKCTAIEGCPALYLQECTTLYGQVSRFCCLYLWE